MTVLIIGIILGLAIGLGCRWFDIPLPSPPSLVGAFLVVAMTCGFLAADYVLSSKPEWAEKVGLHERQVPALHLDRWGTAIDKFLSWSVSSHHVADAGMPFL